MREKPHRVDVHAELVEGDKACFTVLLEYGQAVDFELERKRVERNVLDGDLAPYEFFGVCHDITPYNTGSEFEGGEDEDYQNGDDNCGNLKKLFHAEKSSKKTILYAIC